MKLNIKSLKAFAAHRLGQHRPAVNRTILLYVLILTAVNLASLFGSELLLRQADKMTGLAAQGSKSMLVTAASLLSYAAMVFAPLWQAGFLASCVELARDVTPDLNSVSYALRRPGKYIFCTLILLIRCFAITYGIIFLTLMAASILYPNVPNLPLNGVLTEEQLLAMQTYLVQAAPVLLVGILVALALVVLLLFRYRLIWFAIPDCPEYPSSIALRYASFMMRGVKLQFLKLDLSFWWYYLLIGAANSLMICPILMDNLGIPFPMDPIAFSLVLSCVYYVIAALIFYFLQPKVQLTYAVAYDQLRQALNEKPGEDR